jgi:hypothetical protein
MLAAKVGIGVAEHDRPPCGEHHRDHPLAVDTNKGFTWPLDWKRTTK